MKSNALMVVLCKIGTFLRINAKLEKVTFLSAAVPFFFFKIHCSLHYVVIMRLIPVPRQGKALFAFFHIHSEML